MIALQQALLVLNLLLTLVFGIVWFITDRPRVAPKTKERTCVLLASLFLAYLALMLLFVALGVALKRNALYLALSAYVVVPFAIGRLASYRTLKFYEAVQMLAFVLSAVTLAVI